MKEVRMIKRTVVVAVGTMLAVTVVVAHGTAGRTASMSEGPAGAELLPGDSLNVRRIGSCDTPGYAFGVAVIGDYAYVADGNSGGLRVISVSDPRHPVEVGHCETPGYASGVGVSGDYAYVAADEGGLRVISVTDPAHPVEVGYYDTPGQAWGVALSGDYAYVADREDGLQVISVTDPAHPVEVGYYCDTPVWNHGVAVTGDYAYVADGSNGLQVYQFYCAGVEETPNTEVRTENRMPAIVRGVLMMGQQLAASGSRPELVDATGRTVAELHAGANDVDYLAPGVYFVCPASCGERNAPSVHKVTVTR
jgi:hypothetical protein